MTYEAISALCALARLPIETLKGDSSDDRIIWRLGDAEIKIGHVMDARQALEKECIPYE